MGRSLGGVVLSFVLVACQPGAGAGTSCARSGDCAAGLVCRLGRCRSECSENRDCPSGAQCFLDPIGLGACQLDQDRSCAATCPEGLQCLESQCVRACTMPSDCPADGECAVASGASVGLCIDTRGSDGGVRDAAILDAGAEAGSDASDAGRTDAGTDGGQPTCRPVQHACAGEGFVCALLDDDTVACWGVSDASQCGSAPTGELCGTAPCHLRPSRVVDEAGAAITATSVTCGESHACALTADGAVLCWGNAVNGARGDGSSSSVPYATQALYDGPGRIGWGESSAPPAGFLRSGRGHTCALTEDRMDGRCWGADQHGQLGTGSTAAYRDAVRPSVLLDALAAPFTDWVMGSTFTCLVDRDHAIRCVGHSETGELGPDVAMGSDTLTAVDPAFARSESFVGASRHLCARTSAGIVSCIGSNARLELGRTTTADHDPSALAAPVAGTTAFDSVFSGPLASTTFAISGTNVFAWGDNYRGAAADVLAHAIRDTPQRVVMLSNSTEIALGGSVGCAISSMGSISCWGGNEYGQLGHGSASMMDDPVPTTVCITLP